MKICSTCKIAKPNTEFQKNKRKKDGFHYSCKSCYKDYYQKNAERVLIRKSNYIKKNRTKLNEAAKKYRIKNNEKSRAHDAVKYALKTGKLKKQNCQICGSNKGINAHHEAYDRPLNVVWFCPKHHKQRHKQLDVMI